MQYMEKIHIKNVYEKVYVLETGIKIYVNNKYINN